MNDLQQKIFDHLTSTSGSSDGGAMRKRVLKDLIDREVFATVIASSQVEQWVENYLTSNPQGVCSAGIERFREATGINPKPKTTKLTWLIELEVEGEIVRSPPEGQSITVRNIDERLIEIRTKYGVIRNIKMKPSKFGTHDQLSDHWRDRNGWRIP